MDGWGWGGWLAMSIFMVVFWGGLVALAVVIFRSTTQTHGTSELSALDIARDRYARGEITDDEFDRIRRGLTR